MDKTQIEYEITKFPVHQLRDLIVSIENEISNRK